MIDCMSSRSSGHSSDRYTQCELWQEVGPGQSRAHVAWIPRRFSNVGSVVSVDGMEGLWTVRHAYESRPLDDVRDMRSGPNSFPSLRYSVA